MVDETFDELEKSTLPENIKNTFRKLKIIQNKDVNTKFSITFFPTYTLADVTEFGIYIKNKIEKVHKKILKYHIGTANIEENQNMPSKSTYVIFFDSIDDIELRRVDWLSTSIIINVSKLLWAADYVYYNIVAQIKENIRKEKDLKQNKLQFEQEEKNGKS